MDRGTKSLRVWFTGVEAPIDFDLYNNSFVNKWSDLLRETLDAQPNVDGFSTFYGRSIHSKQELVDRMNECIRIINFLSGEKIDLRAKTDCDQNFLNLLHSEFERISMIPKFENREKFADVIDALTQLNAAIHQCEIHVLVPPHRPSTNFSVDLNFKNPKRFDLTASDLQFFTADQRWGELYLNYSTIGVPVLNAFKNRDKTLPCPQTTFTADMWICFSVDSIFTEHAELKKWVAETHQLDPESPKLAIGYIPLGFIKNAGLDRKQLFDKVQPHKRVERVELVST